MANEQNKSKRLPGFYIALCGCVLAIGVAGYFTDRQNDANDTTEIKQEFALSSPEPEGRVISVNEITTIEEVTPAPTAVPTDAPIPTATAEPEYMEDNPDVLETAIMVNAQETTFTAPASGETLAEFTTNLSFNEALGDYRTHNGIDIAADEGCSISTVADGKIEEISANALGDYISITHSNGFVSKYMCLGSVEDLKAGDEVKAGDVIGTVGKSKGEAVAASHLHFELFKDGKPINPTEYIK